MGLLVKTKNATYVVDRESVRWKRVSESHPHEFDGQWVDGAFTVGEVGQASFAHFATHPRGAEGRWTSRVLSIEEGRDV